MTKKDFKPHKMYHPKTGATYHAKTYAQHLAYKKKGYVHRKPASKRESFTEAVERRMY